MTKNKLNKLEPNEILKRLEIIELDIQSARSAITRSQFSLKAFKEKINQEEIE